MPRDGCLWFRNLTDRCDAMVPLLGIGKEARRDETRPTGSGMGSVSEIVHVRMCRTGTGDHSAPRQQQASPPHLRALWSVTGEIIESGTHLPLPFYHLDGVGTCGLGNTIE